MGEVGRVKPNILVICGPTASGKTALAAALARRFNGEVVSADSMQVYRRMDIGTAKPTAEEMQGVPHHMIDVAGPEENYSVARYVADAVPIVDGLLDQGKLPVIAGGTGLYIDSLVAGRQFAPFEADSGLRQQLQAQVRSEGLPSLYARLQEVDPDAAGCIHPNDEKRIIRALEVWLSTGKTLSQHDRATRALPDRYAPLTIALRFGQRPWMWERIDRRVDDMMERGLEREVRDLLASGVPRDCTAMQAIGYKEIAAAISQGRPVSDGAEEVKLRSRQYAKRQLTWFRRSRDAHWFDWGKIPDFSAALAFSTELVTASGLK